MEILTGQQTNAKAKTQKQKITYQLLYHYHLFVKNKQKNNNSVINESNKIKTLIFLYTLSLPIFWKVFNGKCLWTYEIKIPKGLVATRDVVIHMSYFIANYKGGRNESFMYGYNKIKS